METSLPLLLPVDLPPRQNGKTTSQGPAQETLTRHNTTIRTTGSPSTACASVSLPYTLTSACHSCTRPGDALRTWPHHLARAQSRFESLDIPPDPTIWLWLHPGTTNIST